MDGNTDYYNITVSDKPKKKVETEEIKLLIPEGLRDALSVNT